MGGQQTVAYTEVQGTGLAAYVDVETTGLCARRDEIIELAIITFRFDRVTGDQIHIVDEYVGLREPGCPIPRAASEIHGITAPMVQGRSLDHPQIKALLEPCELVIAHNARFDYRFISRLFPQVAQKPWLCSMHQINWRHHGYPSRALQRLLSAHNIRVNTTHRALDDCRNALTLLQHKTDMGMTYLWELLEYREYPIAGTLPA